jgi:hypothetical protein
MMQKTIGMYIANRVKDEIFRPQEVEDDEGVVQYVEQGQDPLDGELIRDSSGAVLGRAYRVPAAVYVVAASNADADAALETALNDPDHEAIIHWEGDQIGALVFVGSEARASAATGPRGFRADDV